MPESGGRASRRPPGARVSSSARTRRASSAAAARADCEPAAPPPLLLRPHRPARVARGDAADCSSASGTVCPPSLSLSRSPSCRSPWWLPAPSLPLPSLFGRRSSQSRVCRSFATRRASCSCWPHRSALQPSHCSECSARSV